ncbi:hypothetical protein DEO72_LG8g21 [Vigna unguiculata]|uniref:Uncharacterized protein n=1 Tax=Vigna unguiculata TaxID=3917 RepID=A0A4D6MKD1_VIGUN|nr:hypothetical protein DEO72_LG8g21 [Vigna unguiculata]
MKHVLVEGFGLGLVSREKNQSGSFSKGEKVCKESGNLNLEREFQKPPGGHACAARRFNSLFMDGVTCDDMSGEVRRAGLRAGRFVEAGPRAGSSPFLFVCGDDRVIRYTGADVDAGGAEDVQMAE